MRNWKRIIQLAVDLDVTVIGTEFSGRPERAEESEAAFYRSMEELLPIIEREGIDLLIDPHPDDFVEDGLEAIRVIRGLNSPNVGMVFVACHSFHMGHPMREVMRAGKDLIRLVHVADTMDHHASHGLRYISNPRATPPASTSTCGSVPATSTGTTSSGVSPRSASTTTPTRSCATRCSPRTRTPTPWPATSSPRCASASPRTPSEDPSDHVTPAHDDRDDPHGAVERLLDAVRADHRHRVGGGGRHLQPGDRAGRDPLRPSPLAVPDRADRRRAADGHRGKIGWQVVEEVSIEAAKYLEPAFDEHNGRNGRLSMQTDPRLHRDATALADQAEYFASLAPNIIVKIPATKVGIEAIEEATYRGVSINVTVSFTVPQAVEAGAASSAGWTDAGREQETASMGPVVTIMVGRLDDWEDLVSATAST